MYGTSQKSVGKPLKNLPKCGRAVVPPAPLVLTALGSLQKILFITYIPHGTSINDVTPSFNLLSLLHSPLGRGNVIYALMTFLSFSYGLKKISHKFLIMGIVGLIHKQCLIFGLLLDLSTYPCKFCQNEAIKSNLIKSNFGNNNHQPKI